MKTWIALACLLCALTSLPAQAATYVVDRSTDAASAGGGQGTSLIGDLRYAIINAQSGDGIGINVTGTIQLAAALPALNRSICIQGAGADLLTVRGIGGTVFSVGSGAAVTLSGLTITGGNGNGGGIFNQGTLTLNNVTVAGNRAGDPTNGNGTGAGIWNYINATLTINGSTVSGNSATGNLSYASSHGGGIANYGTLTLNDSTVSGNSAGQGFGGGISNSLATSALTLYNSTVSANSSPGTSGGGGIDNRGTLTARNSIVDGNTDGDLSGNVVSQGYNLFGVASGSGFAATDLVNVSALLGPLQDNGGSTLTMAPLAGSPAIDRIPGTPGVNFHVADQRGVSRPQGSLADSGAVEAERLSPTSQSFSATGGQGSVQISARGSWTAVSGDPSWVTITSGSHGSGDGSVAYSVEAYSGSSSRRTTVTINDDTFEVLQGGNFLDVPPSHPFYAAIGRLAARGVTQGCGGQKYCPDDYVTREQMAAFLVRAVEISAPPPPPLQRFDDVQPPNSFYGSIDQIALRQITLGCSQNPPLYCPSDLVSREQMAAFLVRVLHAPGYVPPIPAAQRYQDVLPSNPFYRHVEEMALLQITRGCSINPPLYCGNQPVTRGEMAAFLGRAFEPQAASPIARLTIVRARPEGRSSPRPLGARGVSVAPCSGAASQAAVSFRIGSSGSEGAAPGPRRTEIRVGGETPRWP